MFQKLRIGILKRISLALIIPSALFITIYSTAHAAQYEYSGKNGPQAWGDILPEWSICKTGKFQSPIDIDKASAVNHREPIEFKYEDASGKITNTGTTLQIDFKDGNFIKLDDVIYNLKQMTFHSPSEHSYSDERYEMSSHLIHQSNDGQLLVLAIMLDEGDADQIIDEIWAKIPAKKSDKPKLFEKLELQKFVETFQEYFRYSGSLTTPPCTEGVIWIVSNESVTVSKEQISRFKEVIGENVRPTQPKNGRQVLFFE